jgi:carbon storage regulator
MLVLSRKVGEGVRIGEDVVVTVREVRGSRVRLSVEAPPDLRVLREELTPLRRQPRGAPEEEGAA